MPPLIPHTTPDPDLHQPPAAIVAVQPIGDEPPPLPLPLRGGGPAPVASLPAPTRKVGPNVLGIGALAVTVEGMGSEDEAAAAATGALEALAKRRSRLPARVADRHTRGLLDALERP